MNRCCQNGITYLNRATRFFSVRGILSMKAAKPTDSNRELYMKLMNTFLIGWSSLFFLTACHNSYNDGYSGNESISYKNLFPVESEFNWWKYSDEDGNQFSIHVVDVVHDDREFYYKATFTETKLQSEESHWFRRDSDHLAYAPALSAPFIKFLPKKFNEDRGKYSSDDNDIHYTLYDSYRINRETFDEIVELHYETPILNGFTTISFANKIGPLRFVDDSGRWIVEYNLDSASINGTVIRL